MTGNFEFYNVFFRFDILYLIFLCVLRASVANASGMVEYANKKINNNHFFKNWR